MAEKVLLKIETSSRLDRDLNPCINLTMIFGVIGNGIDTLAGSTKEVSQRTVFEITLPEFSSVESWTDAFSRLSQVNNA
jgi:hypothetical protein